MEEGEEEEEEQRLHREFRKQLSATQMPRNDSTIAIKVHKLLLATSPSLGRATNPVWACTSPGALGNAMVVKTEDRASLKGQRFNTVVQQKGR